MTRKQWINNIGELETTKILLTFKRASKILYALPDLSHKDKRVSLVDYEQSRRKAVRAFLRTNKLNQRDLNVQYGRLAAGLTIEKLYK